MTQKVEVLPHQPQWREAFAIEKEQLCPVFGGNLVAIHHMGSTAIPGIYAKPIIDLLVAVREILTVDRTNVAMVALGYEVMGEFGIPGRRYFRKDNSVGIRTHHVHTFAADNPQVERHLAFRDYLIAHPQAAQQYSSLKCQLAQQFPQDIERYAQGKEALINQLDTQAARWRKSLKHS